MPPLSSKMAQAYRDLSELLEKAEDVRRQFVAAGIPLPPPLSLLYEDGTDDPGKPGIEGLSGPTPPAVATDEWIWVPLGDLPAQELALAVLRENNRAMPATEVVAEVRKYRPDINQGSVFNVGPRLVDAEILHRDEDGWTLLDPERAPLIHDDAAWGPVGLFSRQDVAGYRRRLILELLAEFVIFVD